MLVPELLRAGRALIDARQSDVARKANISLATFNNIERGIYRPRHRTWKRIVSAFLQEGVEIVIGSCDVGVRLRTAQRIVGLSCQEVLQDIALRVKNPSIIPIKNAVLCYSALPRPHFFLWLDYGVRDSIFDGIAFTMDSEQASQELATLILLFIDTHTPLSVLNTLHDVKELDTKEAIAYIKECPIKTF